MEETQQIITIKKDYSILIFRIIGMVCILLCHIGTAIGSGLIAQTFDVGVQFFLFISGYLYANKKISSPLDFLLKRYIRITIPCLVMVVICLIASEIMGNMFSYYSLLLYVTNLQGYYHLFEFIPQIALIEGSHHLWFITVLFVCYILTIIVKYFEGKVYIRNKVAQIATMCLIVVVSFVGAYFGFRLDYILVYFIGYGISKFAIKSNLKAIIISFAAMIVLIACRLVLKKYCDENGDILLYTQIVIPMTYITITVFAFFAIKYIVNMIQDKPKIDKILGSKALSKVDELSFFVYISHYIFLVHNISIFETELNIVLKILIFIIETCIASICLYYINKLIGYCMKRRKPKEENVDKEKPCESQLK